MRFLLLLLFLIIAVPAHAGDGVLIISVGAKTKELTAEELLHHPAAADIKIPKDPSYGRAMEYRAVPLFALLEGFRLPPDQVLQAVAADGFVAALRDDLALAKPADRHAVPYVAVEPPGRPWPKLGGKETTAGPFYIVWLHPEADDIRPEQWPYAVVKIASADSPLKRWPQLALDKNLPAHSPVRSGAALYATNCMVCHRMNGAGDAEVGPDLNVPMNPVEYFRKDALHKYIRGPASVRKWKDMGMKGFSQDALSDREIDLIIGYLDYMAKRKISAPLPASSAAHPQKERQ